MYSVKKHPIIWLTDLDVSFTDLSASVTSPCRILCCDPHSENIALFIHLQEIWCKERQQYDHCENILDMVLCGLLYCCIDWMILIVSLEDVLLNSYFIVLKIYKQHTLAFLIVFLSQLI